jgi:ankyrin repeat protein
MPLKDSFNFTATPAELGWQLQDQLRDLWADMDTVRRLVAKGAQLDLRNKHGQEALSLAAANGHREALRLLIGSGADVDHQDNFGNSALMNAVSQRDEEAVKILLEAGANVNVSNRSGFSALLWAVGDSDERMTRLLLDGGANIAHTNAYGETVIDILVKKGVSEEWPFLRYLREKQVAHDAWISQGMPLKGDVKTAPPLKLKAPGKS